MKNKVIKWLIYCILMGQAQLMAQGVSNLNNQKIVGYRGIWFELNQKYPYGDKYSGGLGTYTAKHIPLAIYAAEVNKTFFVYGGTTETEERHLLSMIGCYDHATQLLQKPTVVYDKVNVNDPHDNPSIMMDDDGYIWVFVSGRGNKRKGIKLKSDQPYNINGFSIKSMETFTYPQIWNTTNGFMHFFTKYSGTRELYFESSPDGETWSVDKKIAGIKESPEERSGHYQVSNHWNKGAIIGTFFNRHPDGHPDSRTDLYYIQTTDYGKSWEDVAHHHSNTPLTKVDIRERVIDYQSLHKNVYLKDMGFDNAGHPVCLYLTSNGHEPGPDNAPYEWRVTHWDGSKWNTSTVCTSDHNYDMGSLFIQDSMWTVVGPTEIGPQSYGAGGEIAQWISTNNGQDWVKTMDITASSVQNHGYVRRPLNAISPFSYFWASGNPHTFSMSELYFGDFEGHVWKMPYSMDQEFEAPIKIK